MTPPGTGGSSAFVHWHTTKHRSQIDMRDAGVDGTRGTQYSMLNIVNSVHDSEERARAPVRRGLAIPKRNPNGKACAECLRLYCTESETRECMSCTNRS